MNDWAPGYYTEVPWTLEPLAGRAEVTIYKRAAASVKELVGWLSNTYATIDIRARSIFDAELLASLPNLRVLVIRGTTAPRVDTDAATRRGILICNTPYQSTTAVAEFALGLLLAAMRRIPLQDRHMQQGEWRVARGALLRGKTLGVIGLGMIGQEMCRLGQALGMHVLGWSPTFDPVRAATCNADLVELDTLLRNAHAVSLHLRLSARTRQILGRRELALLRDGAIFVNTARGALLDEAALIDELRRGRLIAALDTFTQEPLPADHPLLGLDNVLLTPHAAWATDEVVADRARVPIENVVAALAGHPRNVMNPAALEHPNWQKVLTQ